MLKTHYLYGLVLIGLSTLSTQALAELKSYQANYEVIKSGMTLGTMSSKVSINGNNYNYSRVTQANGLASLLSGDRINEQAQGRISGAQIQPQSYSYDHKNRRKQRQDQFRFTGPTTVQGQKNGEAYNLKVPVGTLDPGSMELQLMNDLSANRPLNYQIAEKGELRHYTLKKLGNETVNVPAGSFNAVKVQVNRNNNERQTTFWLAPELNYIPVKMQHSEDGSTVETQLLNHN